MKKTWIKVKRGILEPKHITKLGQAWYLYFYILDQTEWTSGTITDWKDEYASQDLSKPIALIRAHRRLLEDEKYITCEKNQHSQTIIVHNWTDPRRYDGLVQNPEAESAENDTLQNDENFESVPQSASQSVPQTILSYEQNPLSSYSHITHNTVHIEEGEKKIQTSTFSDSQTGNTWHLRVWSSVTGMVGIPGGQLDKVMPALDALKAKYQDEDELIAFMKKYYTDWQTRRTKEGKQYSRTNCAWLYDLAIAEEPLKHEKDEESKIAKREYFERDKPDPDCKVCGGNGVYNKDGRFIKCQCFKGEKK